MSTRRSFCFRTASSMSVSLGTLLQSVLNVSFYMLWVEKVGKVTVDICGHMRLTSGHTRLTSGHTRLISGHKRQRPIMQYPLLHVYLHRDSQLRLLRSWEVGVSYEDMHGLYRDQGVRLISKIVQSHIQADMDMGAYIYTPLGTSRLVN